MSKYGISVKEYVQPRPFSSRGFVSKYLKRKRNAQEKIEKKKKNRGKITLTQKNTNVCEKKKTKR